MLLQISDTHFGTERPAVVEALLRFARAQRPEVVLLSGDVTQRATRSEFRRARAFVDRLGLRTLVIPGNHDIPLYNVAARCFSPYANFQSAFGTDLEPRYESAHWLVLSLKTTRRYRHKDGEISTQQVERIARRLERAAPGQVRLVVVHQPMAVTRREDEPNLLHGRERAIRRWAAAGADLVLGGHIHLPYVLPLHETHAALARRLWVVQAGTAVSSRLRQGADNSVNLIRREGAHCSVERWDFRPDAQAFEPAGRHDLVLGAFEARASVASAA